MVGTRAALGGLDARAARAAAGWLAVLLSAAVLGALGVRSPIPALAVVGVLGLALLVTKPTAAAVLAVIALPFPVSFIPGAPIKVALTDVLILVALTGWALEHLLRPTVQSSLRPVGLSAWTVRGMSLGLLAYGVAASISMVFHPSGEGVVTAAQRVLLVLGPLLLGAGLVRTGRLRPALGGYLVSVSVLAVSAVANTGAEGFLGVQKNPAGGFLAAGLIIAVVLRPYRWWVLTAPVLAIGVLASQSRGALLGLAVATVVTALVVRFGERTRLIATFSAAGVLLYGAYLSLPADAQARLTRFSADSDYAVRAREAFKADAFDVFGSSPWFGIGIGNYQGGLRSPGIRDPHDVLYLQLAEGGVVLLIGFLALVGWSLWCAARAVRVTAVAVAALGVQLSTVTHGVVDVYWVRGTPEPAFLLLGAVLAIATYRRQGLTIGAQWWAAERHGRHRVGAGAEGFLRKLAAVNGVRAR